MLEEVLAMTTTIPLQMRKIQVLSKAWLRSCIGREEKEWHHQLQESENTKENKETDTRNNGVMTFLANKVLFSWIKLWYSIFYQEKEEEKFLLYGSGSSSSKNRFFLIENGIDFEFGEVWWGKDMNVPSTYIDVEMVGVE